MERYCDHYISQIGGGYIFDGDINSPEVTQRGCGIGSYLGGLFRKTLPYLKRGGNAVRKEAMRAGARIAKDHLLDGVPLPEAISDSIHESRDRLKNKAIENVAEMFGRGGYKTNRKRKRSQSQVKSHRLKTTPRKTPLKKKKKKGISKGGGTKRVTKKRKIEDIFT